MSLSYILTQALRLHWVRLKLIISIGIFASCNDTQTNIVLFLLVAVSGSLVHDKAHQTFDFKSKICARMFFFCLFLSKFLKSPKIQGTCKFWLHTSALKMHRCG